MAATINKVISPIVKTSILFYYTITKSYNQPLHIEKEKVMIFLSNGHSFECIITRDWRWQRLLNWLGIFDVNLLVYATKTLTISTIDRWAKTIGPTVDSSKIPLIVPIFGELAGLAKIAEILSDFDLVAIELDASRLNLKNDLKGIIRYCADDMALINSRQIIRSCEIIKAESRHPLLLKLSATHDVVAITPAIRSMVEAFVVDNDFNLVKKIREITSTPVLLCHPWRPTLFVRRDKKLRQSGA